MTIRHFFSLGLLLFTVLLSATSAAKEECVYSLYVKTGPFIKAGTDSKIAITLGDSKEKSVSIPNLEDWGLMGPRHDYFERGNIDIFTGKGPCIATPICKLNVTSDGSGDHHGWLCEYVKVTFTGPHKNCTQSLFHVDQWLASDTPPYQLSAVIDGCNQKKARDESGPFVVNRPVRFAD